MFVVDPLSVFLLGTCCIACWPCLVPCCLSLPIVPYPVLILQKQEQLSAKDLKKAAKEKKKNKISCAGGCNKKTK